MKKLIIIVLLLWPALTWAQHEHHDIAGMNMDDMHVDNSLHKMSSAFSLNLPMNRNGSGTAWQADTTPIFAYMQHAGKWMFMFHGDVFVRYNNQDVGNKGYRGGAKWDAPNMLMAMGQRKVGKNGLFHFNAMFSVDALIAGGSGYPLLFQSGESWQGRSLVDRQHPHDLFSELSVSYAYSFSKKADLFVYAGYPGEPALGPVTFMHRISGMDNPDAPLSHHWVDATHITFGVATLGFRYGKFKLEGSSFTGREPDENRYNFDKPRFDSWSSRLSFNPDEHWALQVSHANIVSPEGLHAREDVDRTTASASYIHPFGKAKYVSATALWGMNKTPTHDAEHAALAEASLRLNRLVVYGRYEWVQKSTEELDLNEGVYGHDIIFPVNAVTLGAGYDIITHPLRISVGAQGSLYHADATLNSLYGKNPMAAEVYLRFYPKLM